MARAAASSAPAVAPLQLSVRDCVPVLLLLGALLCSALLVVQSTHHCRQLYAALQTLERERWALDEEYTRLLLQHGTLSGHRSVEQAAAEVLHMHAPELAQRRVFLP